MYAPALLDLLQAALNLPLGSLLSRLLTALNLLPSMPPGVRQSPHLAAISTELGAHIFLNAGPLSLRKSAIVFVSGASRPVSHINLELRQLRSRAPLELPALR